MKLKIKKLLKTFLHLLPFCLVVLGPGCEEEPIDIDPGKAILGKWEVIENTFGTVSYPGAYEEYRADSILF
jgi:hypothetical protein